MGKITKRTTERQNRGQPTELFDVYQDYLKTGINSGKSSTCGMVYGIHGEVHLWPYVNQK